MIPPIARQATGNREFLLKKKGSHDDGARSVGKRAGRRALAPHGPSALGACHRRARPAMLPAHALAVSSRHAPRPRPRRAYLAMRPAHALAVSAPPAPSPRLPLPPLLPTVWSFCRHVPLATADSLTSPSALIPWTERVCASQPAFTFRGCGPFRVGARQGDEAVVNDSDGGGRCCSTRKRCEQPQSPSMNPAWSLSSREDKAAFFCLGGRGALAPCPSSLSKGEMTV